MGYDAIAFGADDLRLPAGDLFRWPRHGRQAQPLRLGQCRTVRLRRGIPATSRVIEAGGMKIGVTAVLGKTVPEGNPQRRHRNGRPGSGPGKDRARTEESKPDYLVLLAHATMDESVALAKKFPAVQRGGYLRRPARAAERSASTIDGHEDAADHGRSEGNVRHRVGVHATTPSTPFAISACRWIRVSPPRPT